MESSTSYNLLLYVSISFIISVAWLLHRGILIVYDQDLSEKTQAWLNKRSILMPTLAVFIFPILMIYFVINPIPDILKLLFPVITFAVGQFLGKREKQEEIERRRSQAILEIKRKFSLAQQKISSSKTTLHKELASLSRGDNNFMEERLQFLDGITDDFVKLSIFLDLAEDRNQEIENHFILRKIDSLIDEFNELVEERIDHRNKCRELVTTSADQYFKLLEFTDEKLLKVSIKLEDSMDLVSHM